MDFETDSQFVLVSEETFQKLVSEAGGSVDDLQPRLHPPPARSDLLSEEHSLPELSADVIVSISPPTATSSTSPDPLGSPGDVEMSLPEEPLPAEPLPPEEPLPEGGPVSLEEEPSPLTKKGRGRGRKTEIPPEVHSLLQSGMAQFIPLSSQGEDAPRRRFDRRKRSAVWSEFETLRYVISGKDLGYVRCKRCKIVLRHESKFSGTTHLHKHVLLCRDGIKTTVPSTVVPCAKRAQARRGIRSGEYVWRKPDMDRKKSHIWLEFEVLVERLNPERLVGYVRCTTCQTFLRYASNRDGTSHLSHHVAICPGGRLPKMDATDKRKKVVQKEAATQREPVREEDGEAEQEDEDDDDWESDDPKADSMTDEEVAVMEHQMRTFNTIASYFLEGKWTDVEIRANGGSVRCHSAILAMLSPLLKKLLAELCESEQDKVVIVPDFDVATLNCVLELAYLGVTSPKRADLKEMQKLASLLGLDQVCLVIRRGSFLVQRRRLRYSKKTSSHKQKELEGSPHVCPECNRRFISEIKLLHHRGTVHGQVIACPKCGEMNLRHGLLAHIRLQHSSKNFFCKFCNRIFPNIYRLRQHLEILHHVFEPGSVNCHICNQGFARRSTLQSHLKVEHGAIKIQSCDICGREFKYASSLFAHKLTHSDVRKWTCDICSRPFKSSSNLSQHRMLHAAKDIRCNLCDKMFNRVDYLRRHIMADHVKRKSTNESRVGQGPHKLEHRTVEFFEAAEPSYKRGHQKLSQEELVVKNAVDSISGNGPDGAPPPVDVSQFYDTLEQVDEIGVVGPADVAQAADGGPSIPAGTVHYSLLQTENGQIYQLETVNIPDGTLLPAGDHSV